MPQIGELKHGFELDYKNNSYYIWVACEDCGAERWVQCNKEGIAKTQRCPQCNIKRQKQTNIRIYTHNKNYADRLSVYYYGINNIIQ